MPGIVSYAGNHEDVVLARALGLEPSGFYVDVGAAHPRQGSVTKAFYDAGWSGINIEPVPHFVELLTTERERDTTLNCALGTEPGTLTLYYGRSAYGATADRSHAIEQVDDEHPLHEVTVPVRTLADVWHEHGQGRAVDFLKVDVEGAEREVLAGADLAAMAPRIVVVEATEPYSTTPSHAAWEPLLTAAGYTFVLFDGVNRFYVRAGDDALAERVASPANALDHFVPVEVEQARRRAERLKRVEARLVELHEVVAEREATIAALRRDVEAERKAVRAAQADATRLQARIDAMLNSRTWRWTAPARGAARAITPRKR